MPIRKLFMAPLMMTVVLGACATPEVVTVQRAGDTALSCEQLRTEIRETERFENSARREKGVTGTNVAAGLLFWPALLVTYSNVDEAVNAARDRRNLLLDVGHQKGCSGF